MRLTTASKTGVARGGAGGAARSRRARYSSIGIETQPSAAGGDCALEVSGLASAIAANTVRMKWDRAIAWCLLYVELLPDLLPFSSYFLDASPLRRRCYLTSSRIIDTEPR